jgi:hypothetical protein
MKKDKKKINPALAAGAVIGGNVARHNIMYGLSSHQQHQAGQYSMERIKNKLQPGDVFFSKAPRGESPAYLDPQEMLRDTPLNKNKVFNKLKKKLPRFREQDLLRSYGGNPLYHAGIYAGEGNIIHAPDEDRGVVKEELRALNPKGKIVFYRPHKASPAEIKNALNYAESAVGTPYQGKGWISKEILKELVHRKPATGKRCKNHVCTTLVSESYPKQFKHHWAQPADMIPHMKPVGTVGKGSISTMERIAPQLVAPAIRSLKLAVPTAGLAYLLNKKRAQQTSS